MLTRMQHVGEHLAAERARLETELRYVAAQAQRLDTDLAARLQHLYGIDASKQRVQLDMARGVIVLPDVTPATAETTVEATEQPSE